jgi:phosphatidylglycerol---prolipoprotein diacylglyceryl transferase
VKPVLFRFGGIDVRSYPAMLSIGLAAGLMVGNALARGSGMSVLRFEAAAVALLVPALIGARLAFVAGHWAVYRRDLARIWRRSEGGLAMYGGFVLAAACSLVVVPALGLSVVAFWDTAVFTILVAMMFTRVGCLLTGCCAGAPTNGRLGITVANHRGERARRHPSQVFEIALAGILLVVAYALRGTDASPGSVSLSVVAGYGAGRALLDRFRAERKHVRGIPVAQAFSVVLFLGPLVVRTWTGVL